MADILDLDRNHFTERGFCAFDKDGHFLEIIYHDVLQRHGRATEEGHLRELSVDVFIPYCKYHQALLAPVFTIQEKLCNATLGGQTWESVSMRRIEVHPGKTLPRELMVLVS